jgi:hypothetical protein
MAMWKYKYISIVLLSSFYFLGFLLLKLNNSFKVFSSILFFLVLVKIDSLMDNYMVKKKIGKVEVLINLISIISTVFFCSIFQITIRRGFSTLILICMCRVPHYIYLSMKEKS